MTVSIPYSLRVLIRHWNLTLVAVVSLMVGIACCVVGLSIFNAISLRPAGTHNPENLLTIDTHTPHAEFDNVSFPDYVYYRDNNNVFSGLTAFPYQIDNASLGHNEQTRLVAMSLVADNYFDVLGVSFVYGNGFVSNGDKPNPVVVLSYNFWRKLGADPGIIGRAVTLNRQAVTVIGVAEREFTGTMFGFAPDLWLPLSMHLQVVREPAGILNDRQERFLTLIGRLQPGVTRTRAAANMQTLAEQLAEAYPTMDKDRSIVISETTLVPASVRPVAKLASLALVAVVLLVLLIACANTTNLLMGMATARKPEILVRAALGASRKRLIGQLLRESALLSAIAGLLGFLTAYAGFAWLLHLRPAISAGFPSFYLDFRPDLTTMTLTVGLILLSAVATGLTPALYGSNPQLSAALSEESGLTSSRKRFRGNVLVVIQIAVCTIMLVWSGLCVRSFSKLKQVQPGFSARNLVGAAVNLNLNGYQDAQGRAFYENARQTVSSISGVESVTLALGMPLGGSAWNSDRVFLDGQQRAAGTPPIEIPYSVVDSNYFSTFGINLLKGRIFNSEDIANRPEVIIINQRFATKYLPGLEPIGRQIRIQNGNRLVQIIGVVANGKYSELDEPVRPFMYFALPQHYIRFITVIARTQGDPQLWISPLSAAIRHLDPDLVFQTVTLKEQIKTSLLVSVLIFTTVGSFAFLALLLAAVGLYSMVFHAVRQRNKEISIRLAIGAQPRDILRLILRQTTVLATLGIGIGILFTLVSSSLVNSLLYGIRAIELGVLLVVIAFTFIVAFSTAYAATRPFLKLQPMQVLRHG